LCEFLHDLGVARPGRSDRRDGLLYMGGTASRSHLLQGGANVKRRGVLAILVAAAITVPVRETPWAQARNSVHA